jgi:hypothetical protein
MALIWVTRKISFCFDTSHLVLQSFIWIHSYWGYLYCFLVQVQFRLFLRWTLFSKLNVCFGLCFSIYCGGCQKLSDQIDLNYDFTLLIQYYFPNLWFLVKTFYHFYIQTLFKITRNSRVEEFVSFLKYHGRW